MPVRAVLAVGLILLCLLSGPAAAGERPRTILTLGSTGFLDPGSLQAALGVEILAEPGTHRLRDISVVVLANIAFASLPDAIQQELEAYVNEGGALLVTGGSQAFGSGGYQAVSGLVPFLIRSRGDWRAVPFKPPVVLQPGHPILAGVTLLSVGSLNDLNPRPGATEILRASGGQGSFPAPLIAEMGTGTGRVLGIAFDLNELSGMRDRDRFVQNMLAYLLAASRITPGP